MKIKIYDLWMCLIEATITKGENYLTPFPDCFINKKNEKKQIYLLKKIIMQMPSSQDFVKEKQLGYKFKNSYCKKLYDYIENNCLKQFPGFELLDSYEKDIVLKKLEISNSNIVPDFIFRISSTKKQKQKWKEFKKGKKAVYSYHGSTFSNFYSILRNGLNYSVKVSNGRMLGDGVYFSNDLEVGRDFSKKLKIWKKSLWGKEMACVLVAKIIDDDEGLEKVKNYIVVQDTSLIRNQYLFCYCTGKEFSKHTSFCVLVFLVFIIIIVILKWLKKFNF